jgi:hypothetical protein
MRFEPWKEAPNETLTVVVSACVCVCVCVRVCGECFLAFVSSGFMHAHFWCQKKRIGQLGLNPTIVTHACVTAQQLLLLTFICALSSLILRLSSSNLEAFAYFSGGRC